MDTKVVSRFIDSWGAMGSMWGINSSTARVHGLLIISGEPLGLEEISERLSISRGNASMCLKELRNWSVIRRVSKPGSRRDYYVAEHDVWKMFFSIARERKRREFDPILAAVREASAGIKADAGGGVKSRLKQMEEVLSMLDGIASRFMGAEEKGRAVLSFLAGSKDKE